MLKALKLSDGTGAFSNGRPISGQQSSQELKHKNDSGQMSCRLMAAIHQIGNSRRLVHHQQDAAYECL